MQKVKSLLAEILQMNSDLMTAASDWFTCQHMQLYWQSCVYMHREQ